MCYIYIHIHSCFCCMPGLKQYLVLTEDSEVQEEENLVTDMFKMRDSAAGSESESEESNSNSSSSSDKKRKKKKDKKKKGKGRGSKGRKPKKNKKKGKKGEEDAEAEKKATIEKDAKKASLSFRIDIVYMYPGPLLKLQGGYRSHQKDQSLQ